MKKIFSIILSVIFAFSLIITLTLYVLRSNINSNIIMDAISNIDLYSYNDNNGDVYLGGSSSDIIRTNNIEESINSVINDKNIDNDAIKDIMKDKDVNNFIDKYRDEITNYLTGKNDELNIDKDEVNEIINSTIDKYEKETGKVIDRDNLENEINDMIDNTVVAIDKIRDVKPLTTLINIVLGDVVFYGFVALNYILAIIILLINRSLISLLKYLSIPSIVVGALLLIIGFLIGLVGISGISTTINRLASDFRLIGIITLVLGIISCVVSTLCNKEKMAKN